MELKEEEVLDSLELVKEATVLDSEVPDLPSAVVRMRKACSSLWSGEGEFLATGACHI